MRGRSGRSSACLVGPLAVPLAVALALVLTAPAHATQAAPAADDEAAAVDLLTRAMRVAKTTAYRGVQKVQAWTGGRECTQTLEVSNLPGRGTYVRAEDGGSLANAEPDGSTTRPRLRLLTDNYTVLRAGVAKVAGRWAHIVDAKAATHVQARYWLDRATGLMLRREVFDGDGRLARRSWFSSVSFDAAPAVQRHNAGAPPTPSSAGAGGHQVIPLRKAGELREGGWTVPGSLPHGYRLYDLRTTGAGEGKALHLSYSNGISVVSVFEQRGHLDESGMSGWHHAEVGGRTVYVRGTVPRQLMWVGPGTVFTVVADAPDEAVDDTVRALPGAQQQPGLWSRFVRGLSRIVSWCNPF